ncbi:MAG: hypothetical protein GKS00_14615 [Alphaproteobacteria bacterium]|nr:hypothetical protein [Alphaproteobacteria bacterium]
MKALLSVLAAVFAALPAFAHPGMEQGSSFVHDALHMSGGFEQLILVVAIAVGIAIYKKRF